MAQDATALATPAPTVDYSDVPEKYLGELKAHLAAEEAAGGWISTETSLGSFQRPNRNAASSARSMFSNKGWVVSRPIEGTAVREWAVSDSMRAFLKSRDTTSEEPPAAPPAAAPPPAAPVVELAPPPEPVEDFGGDCEGPGDDEEVEVEPTPAPKPDHTELIDRLTGVIAATRKRLEEGEAELRRLRGVRDDAQVVLTATETEMRLQEAALDGLVAEVATIARSIQALGGTDG